MNIALRLPDDSTLTADKIKNLDTLLSLFSPEELEEFYQLHHMQIIVTTKEEIEKRDGLLLLLQALK